MKQFSNRMVAGALAVVMMTGAQAFAKEKQPKKKAYDLSANPLANVHSDAAGQGTV